MKDHMRTSILALALLALTGCSGVEPPPKTVKVDGTINYKGTPLPKGKITFEPQEGSKLMRPASGQIQNGKFTVATFTQGDGALPGTYRIAVESVEEVSMEDFNAGKRDKQLIPKKFANAKQSGLATTVPDQSEPYAFTLEIKD